MQQQDIFQPPPPPAPGGFSPFAGTAQTGSGFFPPTPPRNPLHNQPQAGQALGRMGSFPGFAAEEYSSNTGSYFSPSPAAGGYNGSGGGYGLSPRGMFGTAPAPFPHGLSAADLMPGSGSNNPFGDQQQHISRATGPAQSASRTVSNILQQQQLQQFAGSPHDPALAAAVVGGLPPTYGASPLSRAATVSAQQLLQQQHQQEMARSFSMDVAGGYGAGGYAGGYGAAAGGRWGGRMGSEFGAMDQGRLFGAVYDMKSLTAALSHVQAGTGDVRRMLASCTFRPRLPGLTKLVSQLSREGNWAKALEVYESLDAVGVRPDTTITNAAISACDKGAQWEKALQVFRSMSDIGLERDAITYSALISALSKGRQWSLAIDVFNHMVAEGVECDAVTCCSLITALDKGGQWQLAEQVFIQMYQSHTQFHVLLEGMQQDHTLSSPDKTFTNSPSNLLAGTFSAAALNALTIQEDPLPPAEQLASLTLSGPPGLTAGGGTGDVTAGSAGTGNGTACGTALGGGTAGLGELYRSGSLKLKPCRSAAAAAAAVKRAGSDLIGHGKQAGSRSVLVGPDGLPTAAAASLMECDGAAASLTGPGSNLGSPGSRSDCSQESSGCQDSPGSSTKGSSSSSNSAWPRQASRQGSLAGHVSYAAVAAAPRLISSAPSSSSTVVASQVSPTGSLAGPDSAAASQISTSSSLAGPGSGSGCQDSDSNLVRTLSNAWSRVIGANRAAKAANAGILGSGMLTDSSIAEWSGRIGSSDSSLSASDAVVLLADVKAPGDQNGQQQQQDQSTSPALTRSLSAQLADIGLLPPSAAAAAVKDDDDNKTPAAAPAGESAAAATAGHHSSPRRPPMHPPRRAESAFAAAASSGGSSSSGGGLSPLHRGPSAQIGSPSGNIGLRLGRAGSLNSKKSSPNRVCCNALLAAYARAVPPRWKQALKLLEVMWQCGGELVPDIVSYNTVMKACGNAQQTDIAFQLYHHMQQRGIEPTVATYGTLITIASEAQDYSKVKDSWGWLQASGLPVHVTCVNSYLTALIKEDNWDAAVELFNQLKNNQLGVRPNSVTYNILMSACLTRDKPHTVKALFDEMTAAGLSPTLISFNTLLHAYGKMGAWQESLALITHLCSSSLVRPSATSFNTVFCTLSNVAAAVGELDKQTICSRALEVYGLMLNQPGIHPDTTLYRNMISTFAACKAPQMVLQLALTMAQQGHGLDPATAAAALESLQHEGAWQCAGQLLRSCYDAGALVSHVVLERALLACANEGAWKAAKEVLQVSASANQLDSVAQLLQQYRTHLQTTHTTSGLNPALPGPPGLISPDSLDELLFLTFLQAQYNTGGWVQGLELFKQLKKDRGLGFAAGNAAVHGALLELLVVKGGAEGMVAAVQIVDDCHISGAMAHYLIHPAARNTSTASQACPSPPNATDITSALSSGLLSPEQQLILQLEQAAISNSSPPTSAAAASSLFSPGGFSMSQVTGSIPASLGMSGGFSGLGLDGLVTGAGGGLSAPLSFLDVQGCSAIEAVVLLLSYLGQIVQTQGSGVSLTVEYLRISTGGAGAPPQSELDQVVLYKPSAAGQPSACSSAASATAAPEASTAAAAEASGSSSRGEIGRKVSSSGAGEASHVDSSNSKGPGADSKDTIPATADAVISPNPPAAVTPPAAASSSSTGSSTTDWEVPCSNVSVHTAVLAVLNGQLAAMLGCGPNPMDLLVPFSASGRLALGLLCCAPLPLLLPDESQGGGVWIPVENLRQSVASALDAARA